MILGPGDVVQPGSLLKVSINIAGFRPSDADIATALASANVNVASVRTSLLGSQTDVIVKVSQVEYAGVIGKYVADKIDDAFILVIDADAVQYETVSSIAPVGTDTRTTISLAAIAIIAVVGLIAFVQVKNAL